MSGPAKLLMLLSTPFSLLYSRPSGFRLARYSRVSIGRLSATVNSKRFCLKPRPRSCFSIKASEEIHTQTSSVREDYGGESLGFSLNNRVLHPWPEWSNLVDNLRAGGYFDHQSSSCVAFEVELPGYGNIPEEFIVAANACLSFARSRLNLLRSLSRKDMQVVVENGSPFLFKDALDSARRMRSFLEGSGNNGIESGKGDMVDLMQFLLSNACDPYVASDRKNHSNKELVESSVRNLLSQLADASRTDQGLELSASKPNQFTNGYGQTTRPVGPNIVMKRGDWICQKCNFMNFSRNMKCLECSESRPKRQLTGGEWECPQCDFFNYGKNSSCIRCDCMRPGEAQYGTTMPRTLLDYSNGSKLNKIRTESGLGENDEKADERFSKSSQVEGRGEVSQSKPLDASISQSLDRILGRSSASSQTGSHFSATRENTGEERSSFSSQAATRYRQSERNNSGNVPFVPLAADMFAKSQKSEIRNEQVEGNHDSVTSNVSDQTGYFSGNADSGKSSDGFQLTEKPVNQTEDQEDREMAEKSDRWFKKVAELHDVTDLSSAISDEDFPEIMPMRKGENRFVVSKKKDRSLTSPLYKRRMAMEQSSNTNFVPFVPFPPDYFAKKEKQPEGEVSKERAVRETSSAAEPTKDILNASGKSSEDAFADLGASGSSVRPLENQHPGSENWNTSKGGNGYSESNSSYGVLSKASSAQQPENLEISGRSSRRGSVDGADYGASTLASSVSETGNRGVWNTGSSGKGRAGSPTTGTTISRSDNLQANERESRNNGSSWKGSAGDPSPQPPNLPNERESWNKGFSGKSLEGSAVKEPDPLDMSQEAKEQRWFRRVAQIKDISELSNIPDEDFPEIMPMRKGVNRFVVSKRKTPLERRLTSPQYRRNLPIVSSDPVKKNDDIS